MPNKLDIGGVVFDPIAGTVSYEGRSHFVRTRQARRVLDHLARNFGRLVHRDRIIDVLWSDSPNGGPEHVYFIVANHVHTIRKALTQIRAPIVLRVAWGEGYALVRHE